MTTVGRAGVPGGAGGVRRNEPTGTSLTGPLRDFHEYVGLSLRAAEDKASADGYKTTRVIGRDLDGDGDAFETGEAAMVTKDFRQDRLNFVVDANDKVIEPPRVF